MRSTDEKTRKYLSRALGVGILALTILIVHHFAALSFDKPRDADYYNYDINRMEKEQTPVSPSAALMARLIKIMALRLYPRQLQPMENGGLPSVPGPL